MGLLWGGRKKTGQGHFTLIRLVIADIEKFTGKETRDVLGPLSVSIHNVVVVHLEAATSATQMFTINHSTFRVAEDSFVKTKFDRNLRCLPFGTGPIPFVKGFLLEPTKNNQEHPLSCVKWTDPMPRKNSSDAGTMNSTLMKFILF